MPVDNIFLLAQLDSLLDSVDETLAAMELPHTTKRELVSLVYELYAEAEKAVDSTNVLV